MRNYQRIVVKLCAFIVLQYSLVAVHKTRSKISIGGTGRGTLVMHSGQDIIDVGLSRTGEAYLFGAVVPLNNANWHGPWDCAEFASWAAYQAYGLIFGVGKTINPAKAEPYSGHWYTDAKAYGTVISWQDALQIQGAAIIRAPVAGKIGHVAFAMGDGKHTLEARGKAYGVNVFDKAASRAWSIGCLLPGVDYGSVIAKPVVDTSRQKQPAQKLPDGYLWLKVPRFRGGDVAALQQALARHKVDPGPIDGDFGPMSNAAVISFQLREGLEVDGVVGPVTASKLGLAFPVAPTAADTKAFTIATKPEISTKVVTLAQSTGVDPVVSISPKNRTFTATTAAGVTFIVGTSTTYADDMTRTGLFQGRSAIADSMQFGVYQAADFTDAFGPWAHFISPTLSAEGNARFATINTYDRAAFTFGAPQLAAHTPDKNFIVYLRELLALPDAAAHFPELSLRDDGLGKRTVHLAKGEGFRDLEEVVKVVRPNGKKDDQLLHLMEYLNPSATNIDDAELSAAARLMNWLRLDPKAKELQISVFIDHAKENLRQTKRKVAAFDGKDWAVSLWIMDILHQGRGSYADIATALASSDKQAGLRRIGAKKYATRIATVASAIDSLNKSKALAGFEV